MTTSTAPITLPARHRDEAPIWAFHIAVAWIAYGAALAVYAGRAATAAAAIAGRRIEVRHTRAPLSVHVAVVVAAVSLAIVAVAAALV